MIVCPACSAPAADGSSFCAKCGAALAPGSVDPTRTSFPHVEPERASSTPFDQGRFLPGTVVAGRYRIYGLLGRGGMGEVYRADDLKLGQSVALKFLPRDVETDGARRARFLDEVKIARQISHPNVCRVYDVGDVDGRHFLSMEYVDGEDLASLLQRVGKLPAGKAIEIARDVAAGLAAAHALGIVHRDLKPSNVMIDGRGRARITDFGLATLDSGQDSGRIIGTPAYMAPEQFSGGAITPRSDVYAFGLIVYECLTGKALHDGDSGEEIIRRRIRDASSTISGLPEIDPAVERLLRRCVDSDPLQRPQSAQVVLASLPGGDALAAAMAAGETPSPELVAAADRADVLSLRGAWTLLGVLFASVIALFLIADRTLLHRVIRGMRSPDVLTERAAEISALVTTAPAQDSAWWFSTDLRAFTWLQNKYPNVRSWRGILNSRPSTMRFSYRQSPRPMVAYGWDGRVLPNDPPVDQPGMTLVMLDHRGRLAELSAVPPATTKAQPRTPVDWNRFFAFAELSRARFTPATPEWTPPVASDEHHAWTGTMPGTLPGTTLPIRVEAAAHRGSPVWFAVIPPWRVLEDVDASLSPWSQAIPVVLQLGIPLFTGFLAIRNLRRGRGDRRGAFKLAMVVVVFVFLGRLTRTHHVPLSLDEVQLLFRAAGEALLLGLIAALAYLGLEPYVRRYEPERLISWVRLVNGRLRDPLVGRDVLIGAAGGALSILVWMLSMILQPLVGLREPLPMQPAVSPLGGMNHAIYFLGASLAQSSMDGITLASFFVIFRALFRKRSLATIALYLATTIVLLRNGADLPLVGLAVAAVIAALALIVFRYAGVLGITAMAFAGAVYMIVPYTLDFDAFYFSRMLVLAGVPIALAVAAFVVSLGGKPAFGEA